MKLVTQIFVLIMQTASQHLTTTIIERDAILLYQALNARLLVCMQF